MKLGVWAHGSTPRIRGELDGDVGVQTGVEAVRMRLAHRGHRAVGEAVVYGLAHRDVEGPTHIARHLMEAVDRVRGAEIREKWREHKALMYKMRFIWRKNPLNLTEGRARRAGELERLEPKINRAYMLKELFRHFWVYRRAGWVMRYLNKWFWWATRSRLKPTRNFTWMVHRQEGDTLNYFQMLIDNGTVEDLNNKANLVIRKAYRFRAANNCIGNLYHCPSEIPLTQTVDTFV